MRELSRIPQKSFLLRKQRVWKVKFAGEGVDDAGGGYNESVSEMFEELHNGSLPLLIKTPNQRSRQGEHQDSFMLNPHASSSLHLEMFRFLGQLLGISIRTNSPVTVRLAPMVCRLNLLAN